MRARVDTLLRAYTGPGAELEASPMMGAASAARSPESNVSSDYLRGMRIGRYTLLQQLGEGGCGVVFIAEQREPVRRRVAVKVIKLGMDTREVIARFEAERQALALMDHPNIARVLDAGATETGRPFFVMELVHGVPITRHCDEQMLGADARLQLFVQVCHAIQHAHQKGIIHRDLKPSNILVTMHDGMPVPKIIDFGIAKAMHGRLTDKTLFTAFEQFIGTPAYMSPEQTEMSGLDVDTRSDIYSLGVLLYELLTGRTPFVAQDLVKVGLDEMRRIIRHDEPPKPSTCLVTLDAADRATVARQRGTDGPQLSTLLRGDLDWIVMRAIEKDRTRRYETANNLAADIEHHLRNEPVAARPPSPAYLLQRLVRRNKLAFAAAAGIVAALGLGLVFAMWGLQRERAARKHADREAAQSAQVARFMKDMLAGVAPQVALGRDTKMLRAILDETVERLNAELKSQPEVEANLRTALGDVYRDLGEYSSAVVMHRRALEIRQRLFGEEDATVADSLHHLGEVFAQENRLDQAEAALHIALGLREKLFGSDHPASVASRAALARVLNRSGQSAALIAGANKPAVVRIGHAGGQPSGQTYSYGDILTTVHHLRALEKEFETEGIQVEFIYFPSGPAVNEALHRQSIDFAWEGTVAALTARAAGLDQKLLLRAGGNGTGTSYLVVRTESPFQTLADLKGKRLSTVKGTSGHLTLVDILERHGFHEHDFEILDLNNAATVKHSLESGEADGYVMSRPIELLAQGKVRVILEDNSAEQPSGFGAFLVSGEFEKKHPAVVQRVVNIVVKTAAWNSDENNRDAIFEVWTKSGLRPEEVEKSWAAMPLKRRYSPLLDEYCFDQLRGAIERARRSNLIQSDIDLGGWAERKYLNVALKILTLEGYWPECDATGQPKRTL